MKKMIFALIVLVITNAQADQFTADEICDKLAGTSNEKAVYVFFDAKDIEQDKTKEAFYSFKITTQKKFGEFFDSVKVGSVYQTTQNKIPYQFKQYDFGRLFTQFFGIPKPIIQTSGETEISPDGTVVSKTPDPKYWNIYQLCKSDEGCKGVDGKPARKGGWTLTTGLDDLFIRDKDVFAFLFERRFPEINCVN